MPGSLDPLHYGLLVTVGVVGLILAILALHRMRRRASPLHRPSDPGPPGALRGDAELERLRIDFQSLAREVEGRLDTKMARLKRLIAEADEVAKRLEALRDDGPDTVVAFPSSEQSERAREEPVSVVEASRPQASDARSRIVELFTAGRRAEEIAEEVGLPKGEVELVINLFETERSR